ncbi:MAG: hypothetical protein RLZZ546_2968 [Bacteroidota bacterium]
MITNQKIVIIDYGVGNIQSVSNAIKFLGYNNLVISSDRRHIAQADVFILPGVGAFDEAINNLRIRNLEDILSEEVLVKKKPILGICVGMQMLATFSEENGKSLGLNWINGHVKKINFSDKFPIPHVGWNDIFIEKQTPLFDLNSNYSHFYFDHSYHFDCDTKYISSYCNYGKKITASVQSDNIFGVQFHPEKSQNNGLKLFRSFFNSIK